MADGKRTIRGRDSANLRAEGWSKPNLSDLKSITVDAKCSNQELFEKIKELVSKSILILYGSKADEKYVKIVNLIMLRVRGALSKVNENTENASEQQQGILKNAVEDVTKCIEDEQTSKYDEIDKQLKAFTDSLMQSINESLDDASKSKENKEGKQTEKPSTTSIPTSKETQTQTEKTEDKAKQSAENARIESINSINEAFVKIEDLNKLQDTLNENFQKIQQIIASTPSTTNIENTVTNTIVNTSKEATKPIDELNRMVQPVQTAKMLNAEIEEKKSRNDNGSAFTKKQFIELKKMFIKADIALKTFMFDAAISVTKKMKKIENRMKKIEKALTKSKISFTTIMLFASLFLLPFIVNALWPYIDKLLDKIDFNQIITTVIKKIDWEKHVNDVIDNVWEAIKKKFNEVASDPLKWVVDSFTSIWNKLTEWKNDIWEWVTSKINVFKSKSKEEEKTAEEKSTQKLQESMQKLEEHTDAGATEVQKNCDETVNKSTEDITNAAQQISESVNEMQSSSAEAIQSTGEVMKQSSQEITDTTLPAMQTQVTESANGAINSAQSQLNANISSSEKKLSGELDNLEKTTKANGAPTNVSTTTLTKMESEGEGADISSGNIDAQIKKPETLASTVSNENGKQVELYAKKADIEQAAKDNGEVVKMQQMAGVSVTNTQNVQLQSNVQKNIHGKIVVNAPSTDNTMSQQAMYKDMDASIGEVTKVASIIDVGLKNNSGILEKIKSNVEEYFTEINEMVKTIKDKKATVNNNSLIVQSSNKPVNSATMDHF